MITEQGQAPLILSEAQQAQFSANNNTSRGIPPFHIRNFTQLNNTLGRDASVRGFVNVPIYTYIDTVWEDNLGSHVCNYKDEAYAYLRPLQSTYTPEELALSDEMAQYFAQEKAWNKSEAEFKATNFSETAEYADAIICEKF